MWCGQSMDEREWKRRMGESGGMGDRVRILREEEVKTCLVGSEE